jgi:hypothetical protein
MINSDQRSPNCFNDTQTGHPDRALKSAFFATKAPYTFRLHHASDPSVEKALPPDPPQWTIFRTSEWRGMSGYPSVVASNLTDAE